MDEKNADSQPVTPDTLKSLCFRVGLSLSIELGSGVTLRSQILGWDTDRFILVRLPTTREHKAGVAGGETCLVRFLMEESAYGFAAEVLRIQFHPCPLMFLKFPSLIERVAFRKGRRFRTHIPGKLLDAERRIATGVVVHDFSDKGCLIQVDEPVRSEFKLDAVYYLTFKLFQTEIENLYCTIRNRQTRDGRLTLGAEFSRTTAQEKETIEKFIAFLEDISQAGP